MDIQICAVCNACCLLMETRGKGLGIRVLKQTHLRCGALPLQELVGHPHTFLAVTVLGHVGILVTLLRGLLAFHW